ncbi:methyl-accepting chemotaxis protein, partial [Xanthomonas campestris pv. raphani]|uniref:methyl-accepting chemotaxis protein n=1 Tax=Xanthomonas campestris TaxID=339 RepID=UPI002B2393D6
PTSGKHRYHQPRTLNQAATQGGGTSVVASEVRTLAQRSTAAAKEIKNLIDDSVERVTEGSALVHTAGTTMAEIVSSVQRVTDIMGEISAASQEQSVGIEQVNTTVTQMDETTQQNAALVEEATAAARAMEEQATQLTEAVAVFKIDKEKVLPAGAAPAASAIANSSNRKAASPLKTPAKIVPHCAPRKLELLSGSTDGAGWQEF